MKKVVILRQDHYDSIVAVLRDMKKYAERIKSENLHSEINYGIDYILEILEYEG